MSRIVFCLLLLSMCTTASAREMRLQGAGSDDGSCPEIAAAVAEAEGKTSEAKPRAATPAASRGKSAKPGVGRGETQRVQAPRWHSFLPGMFR
jgi:hypothetical protein